MDTFLVQIWMPADDASADPDLRGTVRHVATGVETPFHGDAEVLRLLHRADGAAQRSRADRNRGAAAGRPHTL